MGGEDDAASVPAGSVSSGPAGDLTGGIDRAIDREMDREMDREIAAGGGRIPFRRYMELALYAPGLGYYASGRPVFGRGLAEAASGPDGSDFVTAPELSPLFGATLAVQVGEWLEAFGLDEVIEFGAGSGALALQLLASLGSRVRRYRIVEVSAALRARQRETLSAHLDRVAWLEAWPDAIEAVVVGNEVLDAMPVDLLHRGDATWFDRGVTRVQGRLAWHDVPTDARPPFGADALPAGATVETHAVAAGFIASLAERLVRGAALFIDYGFPEAEYYHPQRAQGTLACHRGHRVDYDVLAEPGEKDLTAHVDFTRIALAGQDAGLDVAGYTSQGRFLLNLGLGDRLVEAPLAARVMARRLVDEHEMGELFKVLAFTKGTEREDWTGFREGDRRHRL